MCARPINVARLLFFSARSHALVSKNRTLELTNCQERRWIPGLINITIVMCKVFGASETWAPCDQKLFRTATSFASEP